MKIIRNIPHLYSAYDSICKEIRAVKMFVDSTVNSFFHLFFVCDYLKSEYNWSL